MNSQFWHPLYLLLICSPLLFVSIGHSEEREFTLGALLPLTGSNAEQGIWIQQGLELGREEALRRFDLKIHILYEDTLADPKIALAAYQKLRSQSPVPIVYTYGSGVGVALSPVVNRDEVIQIGLATAAPSYRSLNDFNFRNFPSAELEARFLVSAIRDTLNVKELGIIKIDNEYGLGSAAAFRTGFEAAGGTILFDEMIAPLSFDYRSQLLRIKHHSPRYIYLAAYPTEGAVILKQARELGINAQFIASVAMLGSKHFSQLAGQAAEGLLLSTSSPVFLEDQRPAVRDFVNAYEKQYREKPGVQHIYAARAYDGLLLGAQAIDHCKGTRPICLRDYLFTISNYQGAGGEITFDQYGDVDTAFSLQVFQKDRFLGYTGTLPSAPGP